MFKSLANALTGGSIDSLERKNTELNSELREVRRSLCEIRLESRDLRGSISRLEAECGEKESTIISLRNNVIELSDSLAESRRLENEYRGIYENTEQELSENINLLERRNAELRGELEEAQRCLSEIKLEAKDSSDCISRLEAECGEKEATIISLRNNVIELSDSLAESRRLQDEYRVKYENTKQELSEKEQELGRMKSTLSSTMENEIEIEEIIDSTSNSHIKDLTSPNDNDDLNELLDRVEVLEKEKVLSRDEITRVRRRCDNLLNDYNVSNNQIEFYKKRIKELEEELQKLHGTDATIPETSIKIVEETINGTNVQFAANDTIGEVPNQLTIDKVIDIDTDSEIDSRAFFSQSEEVILHMRRTLQEAIILDKPKYVCKYCGQMVKISGRCTERGRASFFSHLYDSDQCDRKTTTGLSRALINARKYGEQGESLRHMRLKNNLVGALNSEISIQKGITDVQLEKTVFGIHPLFKWRRPDVYFKFKDIEVVLELQLSTTFASVIAEREMFYKMNNIFLIWVFNFDENEEHVDLRNLMMKDIYIENHRNAFIIDDEAIEEGIRRRELVLKCDWLEPNGMWHYSGNENYGSKGVFVTLSDLTYNKSTYKPYFHVNSLDEGQANLKRLCPQNDTLEVLELLDKKYERLLERQKNEELKRQSILDALDVDSVVKEYVRMDVAIVKKSDQFGLYNYVRNKEILPAIYRSIKLWNNTRYFLVEDESMKFGLVNAKGESVVPIIYDSLSKPENGVTMVSNIDKESGMKMTSFIDVSNSSNVIIKGGFVELQRINDDTYISTKNVNGAFLKGLTNKYGYEKAKNIYTTITPFSEGLFIAVHKGKWGLLNEGGNTRLDFMYDRIGEIKDGRAEIVLNEKTSYIDSTGLPVYDSVLSVKMSVGTQKKLFVNEWRVYDKNGHDLSRRGYTEIAHYQGHIVSFTQNEIVINESIWADKECGLNAEMIEKTRTGILFKFGGRVAKMNKRQLQRKPIDVTFEKGKIYRVYISCIKDDGGLIYLSPIPCFGPTLHKGKYIYRRR